MTAAQALRVALIGYGFMGAAHSQAWRVAPRFFDLPLTPHMSVIVGRDAENTRAAAERLGWAEAATDWREVVVRDDIDLIDICSPGNTHAEIAVAALEAGKHVLCEKPLTNTVEEARAMASAGRRAATRGIRSMVGFSYRRVPALAFAKQFVRSGRIGQLWQFRAAYLQDWLVDEDGPMTWRLVVERGGLREQELHAGGDRLQRQDGDAMLDGCSRRAGQRGDAVQLLVQCDAAKSGAQMLRSHHDQAAWRTCASSPATG